MTKQQTFNYLLVRLADWYIEQNPSINSYADFNMSNDFGRSKLELLPFIICTANGNRKDLFGMFNEFRAGKAGNVQNGLNYKDDFFETGLFSTSFLNETLLGYNTLPIPDDALLPLIGITETNQGVIEGINNSIAHLKDKNILALSELINFTTDELSFNHKRQSSWRAFHGLSETIMENYGGFIPVDFLIEEKSLFAYLPEKRIFA